MAGNAKELFAKPDVDGGLIGGAVLALVLAVVRAVFGAILAVVLHGSLLLS